MNDMTSLLILAFLFLFLIAGYFLLQRFNTNKKPEMMEEEPAPAPVESSAPLEVEEMAPPLSEELGEPLGQPEASFELEEFEESAAPPPASSAPGGVRGGDPFRSSDKKKTSKPSPPSKSSAATTRPSAPKNEPTTIDVFYGTDRKKTGNAKLSKFYGGERNNQATDGPMEYGICKISIPPNHKVGQIESPKWWKLEFRPNVKKHVVLQTIDQNSKEDFFQKLKNTVAASQQQQAFVFVHGYNVNFDDAAKRTAQIAFDLAFDGAPIMYSWPSRGDVKAYTVDESNIQWTKPHLQQFLTEIAESSGATTIHLIAHSMGNRALTRAFSDLVEEQESQLSEKFQKVILTAPDIDADVFKQEIAPAMLKSKAHITLYASSNDKALIASKVVHGHPRAGDSGEKLVVLPGIDTIDASAANTGLLGHSYFAESLDVITDIFDLLNSGEKAANRSGLIPRSNTFGEYWEVLDKNT